MLVVCWYSIDSCQMSMIPMQLFIATGIKSQAYIAPAGNIIAVAPKTGLNIKIYFSQTILGTCRLALPASTAA